MRTRLPVYLDQKVAADILSAKDLAAFKQLLIERRDALLSIVDIGRNSANVVELDQSKVGRLSRMDAMQQQAMSQETSRRREVELTKLTAALRRVDAGDFGYCRDCEEAIALKRLEINPAATRCIQCAEQSS